MLPFSLLSRSCEKSELPPTFWGVLLTSCCLCLFVPILNQLDWIPRLTSSHSKTFLHTRSHEYNKHPFSKTGSRFFFFFVFVFFFLFIQIWVDGVSVKHITVLNGKREKTLIGIENNSLRKERENHIYLKASSYYTGSLVASIILMNPERKSNVSDTQFSTKFASATEPALAPGPWIFYKAFKEELDSEKIAPAFGQIGIAVSLLHELIIWYTFSHSTAMMG